MRNHVLVLMTSAVILACGGAASAQAPGAQSPGTQHSSDYPADFRWSDDAAARPTRRSESACESNCKSASNVAKRKIAIRTATVIAAE